MKNIRYNSAQRQLGLDSLQLKKPIQLIKPSPLFKKQRGRLDNISPKDKNLNLIKNDYFYSNSQQPETELEDIRSLQKNLISTPHQVNQINKKTVYSTRQSPDINTSIDRNKIPSIQDISAKRYLNSDAVNNNLSRRNTPLPETTKNSKQFTKNYTSKLRTQHNQSYSLNKHLQESWVPAQNNFQISQQFRQEVNKSQNRSRSDSKHKQNNSTQINKTGHFQMPQVQDIETPIALKESHKLKTGNFFKKVTEQPLYTKLVGVDEFFEYVLRYAVRTRKGYLPNNSNKVNQDAYIITPNIGKKSFQHFFSVCDGHGLNGHFVSGFLKSHFPLMLNAKKDSLEQNPAFILDLIFKIISQKLQRDSQIELTFSGSTVVSVYLLHNKYCFPMQCMLFCANLGDSRAVMARKSKDIWQSIPLSRDHKPSDVSEQERIIQCGGRVESFKDHVGNSLGPLRVWVKNEDVPGLAMTRSMGDQMASSVGVLQDPEILEFTITQDDKMIIIGSDGVWEFIDNDEAVQLLVPFYDRNDLEGACDILLTYAHNKWSQRCSVIDDVTFILIFLSY